MKLAEVDDNINRFLFPGSSLEGDAAKKAGKKGVTTATKQQQPQPPDPPGPDAPVQEKLRWLADQEKVVIEGLDRAVLSMKKGEIALVTIPPEYAYGSTESKQDLL
ncbi:uncharacterized protein [Lolium perenne]|uniref:uncharacterized protein isoform X2 n=1 Tax=Lolium perenne TaxID=4522 RepID=UPI003A9972BF